MISFQCEKGHEFEKLMAPKKEFHKWCQHCDALTQWMEILDPHSQYFKEKVCSECLGSELIKPILSPKDHPYKEAFQTDCPECNGPALQVLKVEVRGSTSTGPNHLNS